VLSTSYLSNAATAVTGELAVVDSSVCGGPPGCDSHALLWNWRTNDHQEINPSGHPNCTVSERNERFTAGTIDGFVYERPAHAVRFDNQSGAFTDLHPDGYDGSEAFGVCDRFTVGSADRRRDSRRLAIRWDNATNVAQDITPPGYGWAVARAVNDRYTVGSAQPATTARLRALRWDNLTGEVVELNPGPDGDNRDVEAFGVSDAYTVGSNSGTYDRALLWNNATGAVRDITPAALLGAIARRTNGVQFVGDGAMPGSRGDYSHALLWDNATGNGVDLHPAFGPAYAAVASYAFDIDSRGTICGELFDVEHGTITAYVLTPNASRISRSRP
jgi:hypothetical protein